MTAAFTAPEQVPADLDELGAPTGVVWLRTDEDKNLWYCRHNEDLTLTLPQLFADYRHMAVVVHERHDPPGPELRSLLGVCGVCGNTGVVHGPGQNGNWTGEACGCDAPYCSGCGEAWPCYRSGDRQAVR